MPTVLTRAFAMVPPLEIILENQYLEFTNGSGLDSSSPLLNRRFSIVDG